MKPYKIDKSLSKNGYKFIDDPFLEGLINNTPNNDAAHVRDIVSKSLDLHPLTLEETAVLINANDPDLTEEIFNAARVLKQKVYGNRIVLFAPLYIGSECVNDCGYCGFRRSNADAVRRTLNNPEIQDQVEALLKMGHKRLILVFGEHPIYSPQYIADTVRYVYSLRCGWNNIRRVNINAAPLDRDGFKIVHDAGIGTYQIFQETYHKETYHRYHPVNTPKGDYLFRLDSLSRAFEGGVDDMGIGVLFGLYDWRFEVLSLVCHSLFLQKTYGVGPHTISFPRIREASGINLDPQWLVSDFDFKRLVAILRLSVPYTGMILTARESADVRRELINFGVSQIDAGSRLEIGGYTELCDGQQIIQREQFSLGDMRSLDVVIRELLMDGQIPSFCTSCYRKGRTGERFMEYAVPGFIEKFCTPNALLTLKEYLEDFASPATKAVGDSLIEKELESVNPKMREKVNGDLLRIEMDNERDNYY